ncbi:hypothetical protein ABK040_006819 [Willaertia magna]
MSENITGDYLSQKEMNDDNNNINLMGNEDDNNNFTDSFMKEQYEKLINESPFDVEQWSDDFYQNNLSFKTFTLPITIEEAKAIVHCYQFKVLKHKNVFTELDEINLNNLKEKIKQLFNKSEIKYFIRLSTRSPKDAWLFPESNCYQKLKELIKNEFLNLFKTENKLEDVNLNKLQTILEFEKYLKDFKDNNLEYLIFVRNGQKSLSVTNENDVIDLLTHSERVLCDLLHALDFPKIFNMKIIIREWNESLQYEYEFRGFINNFNLIALTQYDNIFYLKELNENQFEIGQSILNYYNLNIKNKLIKLSEINKNIKKWNGQVIMDFGILKNKEIIVIECNPFNTGTGASLFERDRHQLIERYNNNNGFEFRVVTREIFNETSETAIGAMEYLFNQIKKDIINDLKQFVIKEEEEENIKPSTTNTTVNNHSFFHYCQLL